VIRRTDDTGMHFVPVGAGPRAAGPPTPSRSGWGLQSLPHTRGGAQPRGQWIRRAPLDVVAAIGGKSSSPGSSSLGSLRSALRSKDTGKGSNLGILSLTNFLKTSLDITREPEVRRVIDIVTNKNSLFASKGGSGRQAGNPHARMVTVDEAEKVVKCLEEFGFTAAELRQLMLASPQVLCYSVPRIEDLLTFLERDAGLSAEDVRQTLLARPTIMGLPRGQLEQIVGFLLENGSNREDVKSMLQRSL